MPAVESVPLTFGQLDAAAAVLVRSFAADPGLLFVLPDNLERARLGPRLAQIVFRYALRCGTPLATAPPLRGVALWFPPGAAQPIKEDFVGTAPTIENVRYYERRGFHVVAETDIPSSDVHVWCMRREPIKIE